MSWLSDSVSLISKGSAAAKATSLGGLHQRRRETGAQYFTGGWIVEGIWSVLAPSMEAAVQERGSVSVLDTSVGSGRLLAPADKDSCILYGLDIDERCIQALSDDAGAAGMEFQFEVGRMEDLRFAGMDYVLVNPPFSINLQSPLMSPYDCTCYGKYGPHTSALSHEYAVHQALDGASIVAVLLPVSMEEFCRNSSRLRAIYTLPKNAFAAESAAVSTAVFLFGAQDDGSAVIEQTLSPEDKWIPIALAAPKRRRTSFGLGGIDQYSPSITLPVTGDNTVRLEHHNRRLVLKFNCGLTQAKVLNGLFVADVRTAEGQKRPDDLVYRGSAKLLMDTWLLQDDPHGAFDAIVAEIQKHGGQPKISPTLLGFWRKLVKRHERAMTPFRQWIKKSNCSETTATAKRSFLMRAGDLSAPAVKRGDQVVVELLGGEFRIQKDGCEVTFGRDDFDKRFDAIDEQSVGAEWKLIEEGLNHAFPALGREMQCRLKAAGIDWLWEWQALAAGELMIKPYGSCAAWRMGTGKARLSIALALVAPSASLVVVEPGLLPEMKKEVRDKLKLDSSLWRVITADDDPNTLELRQVNLVSYNTLKRCVRGKTTLAKLLRRRFHTVVADEGGILANLHSQQSRALLALSPQKLIVSDGTPIPSYPRTILNVIGACSGQSVAHQPFGLRNEAYIERRLYTSASYAERGLDRFRDQHMVLDWCTNEFKDSGGAKGAKREIPRIANVVDFRHWVAPNVQRKQRYEPEVEPYAGCPKPIYKVTEVPWDRDHLQYYLDIALHFANWYMNHIDERKQDGKGSNLVMVLARISAVMAAANAPHAERKHGFGNYQPLTSKQRVAIEKIQKNVADGKKTMLYAYSPSVVDRLHDELGKLGIDSVKAHGGISITKRTKAIDEDFRYGNKQVLLSTWVLQKGLNLPEVEYLILYDRDWNGRTEDQAIHRTQRPDQPKRVVVDRLHIQGSVNEYVAQVVDWKQAAADSGLDWGDGVTETAIFQHMDSIIEKFCVETLNLSSRDAFKYLAA